MRKENEERPGPQGDEGDPDKGRRMDDERASEREEGITAARRGSRAAPSDRPENEPPHPQDVNEIGESR
ncbi:MAG TPA: hypothetical protein VFV20_11060 [Candidatus Limnocylindria bacterium]|nr:hypothetical protein [Candidatus Limnocylindria bacterium]